MTTVLDDAKSDFAHAVRTLRSTPGFTAVAVVILAIGIGASAAIFTLIDRVLLQPLPVRDPDGLVLLGNGNGAGNAVGLQGGSFRLFSYDLYRRLRTLDGFQSLCAAQSTKSQIAVRTPGASTAEPAWAKLVSGNYFDVLGTRAAAGRLLRTDDDAASADAVAVISFRYWKERLKGQASAIGTVVTVDRVPITIVGVAAAEFYGETLEADPPSFWIPISVDRRLDPARTLVDAPDQHWLYLIGRLAPPAAPAAMQARISLALQDWLRGRAGERLSPERAAAIGRTRVELTPARRGVTHTQRTYASVLRLLLTISAAVLLIACANIATLLLARGAARERERAIRVALGASRGRLIRQSLTESLTLAFAGGAAGLLATAWFADALLALAFSGAGYLPVATFPDLRVTAFVIAVSCGAAILFGALPAVGGRADVRITASPPVRWTRTLVIGQVAIALVVLTAAAGLTRSLTALVRQSFGFNSAGVLVVTVDPARAGYTFDRLGPLYGEIQTRLSALPGVASAALSYYSPFTDCCWSFDVSVEGAESESAERSVLLNRVSAGCFETLGTRLLRGRTFGSLDTPASRRVAIVNEAFVRKYLGGTDPIGRRFGIGSNSHTDLQIVGVVDNAKYESPRDEWQPMAFLPLLQIYPRGSTAARDDPSQFIRTIVVRAADRPDALAPAVRRTLAAVDPDLAVLRVDTLSDEIARATVRENAIAVLSICFGLVALAVTCAGLYGSTAYGVERRAREIGIRMALGARQSVVLGAVIRDVLTQTAVGVLAGAFGAFAALRLLSSALYGVAARGPESTLLAAAILVGCVTAAGYLPARGASRIDPVDALRHE